MDKCLYSNIMQSQKALNITLKQPEFNAFEKKLAVALEDTHTGSKTDKK